MSNFRLDHPRLSTKVVCHCYASPELFLRWEDTSPEAKLEFEQNGSIPCEGGGLPGEWCCGCRFGELEEPEDI